MQAVRDRALQPPFSSWIDPAEPLPKDVRLHRRTVKVFDDAVGFLMLGGLFGGMGTIWGIIPLTYFDAKKDGLWMPLAMGAVAAGCLWVPLELGRNLWTTLDAWRDLRKGRLRQGFFIGREGLLARLAPNECYVVPWKQFVEARRFPPAGSIDGTLPRLVVETLEGSFDCRSDAVEADEKTLNEAAARSAPGWKPPPPERADREARLDPRKKREQLRLAAWFVAALVGIVVVAIGSAGPPGDPWRAAVFWLGAAVLGASAANLVRLFARIVAPYDCPQCGRPRLRRLDGALPAIRYYCPQCNVEWDTATRMSTED